jgi:hypothetical protein
MLYCINATMIMQKKLTLIMQLIYEFKYNKVTNYK